GMIPRDWELISFGDLFNFSGGLSASRDQLSENGTCYLHYGDIHTSNKTFIDVSREYLQIPKLQIEQNAMKQNHLLQHGDVEFVDASEDDAGTSKHVVILNTDRIPYLSGLHTIVAKPKANNLDINFKQYCFQSQF